MTDAKTTPPAEIEIGQLIDQSPISGLQKRVMILGSMATFIDGYDIQALGLAIPGMARSFGIAPTAFAPALSLSMLGVGLGAIIFGPLADRIGRRPVLIGVLVLIGLSTLGAMIALGPAALACIRLLTGLGVGGAVPVALAMTAEYAPARRRAVLVTAMVASMALGSFVAGVLAPSIEAMWGWRGLFGVGAIAPLAMAAVFYAAYPESMRLLLLSERRIDEVKRQVGLISPAHAGSLPIASPPQIRGRARFRDLFTPAFRHLTVLIWVTLWFNLFTVYSLIGWLPTLLASAGWDQALAQRMTGVLAIGTIVGGVGISWLRDRGHATMPLFIAYGGAAVIFCGFLLWDGSVTAWMAMLVFLGLGVFGAQAALASIAAAFFYPPELCSTGVGWFNAIGRTGAIAGPLMIAHLIDAGWGTGAILATLALPMIVCAAGVLLLPRALRVRDRVRLV